MPPRIILSSTRFDQLKYVLDAGRKPLDIERDFREAFGLDRVLRFRVAEPRVPKPQDWWSAYE